MLSAGVGSVLTRLSVVPADPDRALVALPDAETGVVGGAGNAPRTDPRRPVGVVIDDRSGTVIGAGRRRAGETGSRGVMAAGMTNGAGASVRGRAAEAGERTVGEAASRTESGVGVIERGSVSVSARSLPAAVGKASASDSSAAAASWMAGALR
jgi:hypothetical protein